MPERLADPTVQDPTRSAPLVARIRATFLAPGRLPRLLVGSVPWLDVLLITTAVAAITVLALPDEVFLDRMQDAVTRRGDPVEITSGPSAIVRWGRGLEALATIATHPILVFCLAGLLTLVFSVLGQGRAGFRDYLSLAAHGMLIPALGSAVVFLIRIALRPFQVDLFSGAQRSEELTSLVSASISAVDPFTIWMMIVLGIGAGGLDSRHSAPRSAAVLVAGYLLIVLLTTALLHPGVA